MNDRNINRIYQKNLYTDCFNFSSQILLVYYIITYKILKYEIGKKCQIRSFIVIQDKKEFIINSVASC